MGAPAKNTERKRGFRPGILLVLLGVGGALLSCTPHENAPPIAGSVAGARMLSVDSGGSVAHRASVPVLAVHLKLVNPGAEVRLLGYRYETAQGIVSEALMDRRLMEESRSRIGRLVRLGLPTVFPAGSTSEGWVFFRTPGRIGRLRLSLRDVYGRFSDLYIPVSATDLPKVGTKIRDGGQGGPSATP